MLKNLVLEGFRLCFLLRQRTAQGGKFFLQRRQLILLLLHFQPQRSHAALAKLLFRLVFILFFLFQSNFLLQARHICRIILPLFLPQADLTLLFFDFLTDCGNAFRFFLQNHFQLIRFFPQGGGCFLCLRAFFQILRHFLPCVFFVLRQLLQLYVRPFRLTAESGCFRLFQPFFQPQIFLRFLALFLQRGKLPFQFADNIIHAHKVLLFLVQLCGSFIFPRFIFDNACRFFKNTAAFIALCTEDFVNPALPDDGIAFPAHAGIHKQLLNVFQAAGRTVDAVFAFTGAVHAPRHLHLCIFHRQTAVLIINDNGNLRKAERLPAFRSGENNVLHFIAAQAFHALLPKHPAHSVGNVALATAVGADYGRYTGVKFQLHFFRKGLKSL